MSLPSTVPSLEFVGATETSIKVQFTPLANDANLKYAVQWKDYQSSWGDAKSKMVTPKGGTKCTVEAEPLEPGTSYCVRLLLATADGLHSKSGPEIVVDTEQVGCTPKTRRCVIL